MSIFKACDIRGVYDRELDVDTMADIGRAVATLLARRAVVLAGFGLKHRASSTTSTAHIKALAARFKARRI